MYLSNSSQKLWISDIIRDSYKRWYRESVILDAGTASGKTYFCIHVLGTYAQRNGKSILYLCNRHKLRSQIYYDVCKLGLNKTIYVTSYQSIQKKISEGKKVGKYDYIIADECHYFTTDAKFNGYTDVSYKWILAQRDSVTIWMSATAKIFFRWLIDKKKVKKKNVYVHPKNYSYVKHLYFYKSEELKDIIDDILENEPESKILVFCNAGSRMLEMNRIYGDTANYYCSNNAKTELKDLCGYDVAIKKVKNRETGEWEDKEIKTVKDCIICQDEKITFEKRILFTTSVLDNGVDLKDENIKHVITELFDVDSMLQSLGRKRSLNDNDTCTFYIRVYQKQGIQGFINRNNQQLEPVQLYKEDYQQFHSEYGNGKQRRKLSSNKIFYPNFLENKTSNMKVNECRYQKYEQDHNILELMKEMGYIPVITEFLGSQLESISEEMVVDVKAIDLFMEYLKSIEGKWLYSDDRERLSKEFEIIGVKLRYKGGINTFNGALEDLYKSLYEPRFINKNADGKLLVDKRRKLDDGTDNPNRDKTYWILQGG